MLQFAAYASLHEVECNFPSIAIHSGLQQEEGTLQSVGLPFLGIGTPPHCSRSLMFTRVAGF